MSEIGIDILIISLLILANAMFAMSEMAIVTARKSRLQEWASNGNLRAKTALELAHVPNRFLLAVQIGITFVGILAGVFGATILTGQVTKYRFFFCFEPYSRPIAFAWLSSLSLTFCSLSASFCPSVLPCAIPRQSRPWLPYRCVGFQKYCHRLLIC